LKPPRNPWFIDDTNILSKKRCNVKFEIELIWCMSKSHVSNKRKGPRQSVQATQAGCRKRVQLNAAVHYIIRLRNATRERDLDKPLESHHQKLLNEIRLPCYSIKLSTIPHSTCSPVINTFPSSTPSSPGCSCHHPIYQLAPQHLLVVSTLLFPHVYMRPSSL
jgi:hypothetical protein